MLWSALERLFSAPLSMLLWHGVGCRLGILTLQGLRVLLGVCQLCAALTVTPLEVQAHGTAWRSLLPIVMCAGCLLGFVIACTWQNAKLQQPHAHTSPWWLVHHAAGLCWCRPGASMGP
jgi:hypothetical protein